MEEKDKFLFVGKIEQSIIAKNIIKALISETLIAAFVYFMAYSITMGVLSDMNAEFTSNHMIGIILIACIPYAATLLVYWYLKIYFRNFVYKISDKFIVITSGVLNIKKTTIPFSRIQNINIVQGVFDRMFDLRTVNIETAGNAGPQNNSGIAKSEGFIPGLKNTKHLEDIVENQVNKFTQQVPDNLQGRGLVFEDSNIAFDEFIAYVIGKIREGEDLKTRVRELREKAGMTQSQLADKIGVSRQTINYLENGKYSPSLTLALKIARLFEVPVENIFILEDDE